MASHGADHGGSHGKSGGGGGGSGGGDPWLAIVGLICFSLGTLFVASYKAVKAKREAVAAQMAKAVQDECDERCCIEGAFSDPLQPKVEPRVSVVVPSQIRVRVQAPVHRENVVIERITPENADEIIEKYRRQLAQMRQRK